MDGMLSQDEINALLSGMSLGDDDAASGNDGAVSEMGTLVHDTLTPEEEDALGEISNISMGTAATTLSALINQRVDITTPKITYTTWDELSLQYDRPCVLMHISYKEGLDGNNILVLRENDVKIITDLMMGGTGVSSDEPLSELHLSAIGEAMNQMMGSAATSLSSMLERKIDISPPVANLIDFTDGAVDVAENFADEFIMVSFKMDIGTLINSELMQLYPLSFARELYQKFMENNSAMAGGSGHASATPQQEPQSAPQSASQQAYEPQMDSAPQNAAPYGQPPMGYGQPPMGYGQPPMGYGQPPMGYGQPVYMQAPDVNVQSIAFQPLDPAVSSLVQRENINLIKDVPLEVSVELGRTQKSISDILEFAPGTIVELDKIAGEPIDVYVNGKLVAKGEVVVIEESFGVRIIEVLK